MAPIRAAGGADAGRLAGILGAAFAEDPVMLWMFRERQDCTHAVTILFRALLQAHYLRRGVCALTEGGAAVWTMPGAHEFGALGELRLAPGVLHAARLRIDRLLAFDSLSRKHQPREPHWYLHLLGVEPHARGKGIGGALLEKQLAVIDEAGLPAHLESTNERNVPLYERHGFTVTAQVRIRSGSPEFYPMWRPAGGPG
ncbi:GNAT family N-acetyltransferase [Sciscionella marina]|uniref:GNAT family N-acetyltransferase n=1 Tax=Sciscionella marina TaxID=508770 RepID=UPI0003759D53|nr:GNAT family N-acetyltransferase [Sciscionella marina]